MKKENIVVREITNEDRIQIADLYCRVFAGAPWFEDFWTREKALKVLDSAINNNGFRGVKTGFSLLFVLSLNLSASAEVLAHAQQLPHFP